MQKIKVAINGLGRIGRAFLRASYARPELDIVAINDLGDAENLAYLLRYDSVYGRSPFTVEVGEGGKTLIINSKSIALLSEREPASLPWGALGVDIVVEATGFFASFEKSRAHLSAGAKRVVISAPVKDKAPEGVIGATVLMGINEDTLKTCDISSNASCTTNANSPVIQILSETLGIQKALLTTVHGYTSTQALVDSPNSKDFRRGRAAAYNIVPASTGAAQATTKVVTSLANKYDGIAMRVPVIAGSIADITFLSSRATSVEEVNSLLENASREARWSSVFSVTHDPLVSADIVGAPFASIADLAMTRVVDGDLVKVLAWYDNEMGYTHALVAHVVKSGEYLSLS